MYRAFAASIALALTWLGQIEVAAAANVAVLMPGSGGIHPRDFLVRNEDRIKGAGIRTIMTTSSSEAANAIAAETAQGRKVVIVGMSKGAVDAAAAIAAGARPTGVVLVSGVHSRIIPTLGAPDKLPPTLVIHHTHDICKFTLPITAVEFVTWSGGRARLLWIDTVGQPSSDPCNAVGAHGFFRQDGPAITAIINFIRSH